MSTNWYMAVYSDDAENEFEKFDSDKEAIDAFANNEPSTKSPCLLEIHRCNDDECLTPAEQIWG